MTKLEVREGKQHQGGWSGRRMGVTLAEVQSRSWQSWRGWRGIIVEEGGRGGGRMLRW